MDGWIEDPNYKMLVAEVDKKISRVYGAINNKGLLCAAMRK